MKWKILIALRNVFPLLFLVWACLFKAIVCCNNFSLNKNN